MADYKKVLNELTDAITASGKTFDQIGKQSIFNFFNSKGINRDDWQKLYEIIKSNYEPKQSKKQSSTATQTDYSSEIIVDYSKNSQNDVKVRTPRKNVFGDIIKIS